MKASRLEKIYIVVLMVILGGIILHAPLSVWLGVLYPDYELFIKSWKEIIMLGLLPVAVIIITKRGLWQELLHDWIFRIIVVYVLLHFVIAGLLYEGAATAAGLAIDLRYILFFGLVYIAIKVTPQYRRRMLQIGVAGAFIVVGFATLQLFLPPDILAHIGYSKETIVPYLTVDKNHDYIRVNSTLRGPNPLGAYACMVLGVLAAALAQAKLQLRDKKVAIPVSLLAICSLIALWISYSRSALVAGLITTLVVIGATGIRKVSRRVWIVITMLLFTVLGALIIGSGSPFVLNVLLHENPAGGSTISSNDDHVKSLEYGFSQMIREPFGSGIGSTGSASLFGSAPSVVENQYLFIAHETGWLGLTLFLVLFVMIMARLWQQRRDWLSLGVFASGVGLSLVGLLLPVWADDTVSIVWWGCAAIALAGGGYARKQTK